MKSTKILYWVFTILFAALMLFSAIPDVLKTADAIKFTTTGLGYPVYILPFLGIAKILGVIVILIPGLPRLKEWAYAGLMIDLFGATYSIWAIGTPFVQVLPMFLFIAMGFASYFFYYKRMAHK